MNFEKFLEENRYILRNQGIPTGMCYQHLTLAEDDSKGYCLH